MTKFIEYSLYLFFLTFPFTNPQSFLYGGTSFRAVSLIFMVTVLGLVISFCLLKKQNTLSLPKSPIIYVLGVYFAGLIISSLVGLDFGTSFWSMATRMTGLWYLINLVAFMYLLSTVISDRAKQDKLILIIILSTALYSVLSLLGPEGLGWLFKGYFGDAFTFGNSTFAGMYIFGAFLLSIYYLVKSMEKKWWLYLLPVLLIINPNILNSKIFSGDFSAGFTGEARATAYVMILSLFGLVGIWLLSKIKDQETKRVAYYSIFGIALVGAVLASFSLLYPGGFLQKAYLSQATAARPLIWETSGEIINQKPFFGWGTDNFERVFEHNAPNQLLQDEYGNEAWFDRAHNIFIDQAIDNGLVGLSFYILVYLVIILSLIYVVLNSKNKEDRVFASILMLYFPLHFVELQTAFDTTISYPLIAFMVVSVNVLFNRTQVDNGEIKTKWVAPATLKLSLAVLFAVFFLWSLFVGIIPFVRTQLANGYIRTVGSAGGRIPYYPVLFASPVDVHAFLWRTSTDFQRGIASNPKVLEDPQKVAKLKEEIVIFENGYRDYIKNNPNNFRARLNLADILIYQRLFNVDKLAEAQTVLDGAIKLVPQSPQPFWMKAVAYVYMGKFDLARESAKKGLALNPKVKQSQAIIKYVEGSRKTFPDIGLYFFQQI